MDLVFVLFAKTDSLEIGYYLLYADFTKYIICFPAIVLVTPYILCYCVFQIIDNISPRQQSVTNVIYQVAFMLMLRSSPALINELESKRKLKSICRIKKYFWVKWIYLCFINKNMTYIISNTGNYYIICVWTEHCFCSFFINPTFIIPIQSRYH